MKIKIENDKAKFNRILHNLDKYLFFKYLGNDWDIFQLEKYDIQFIENAIKDCDSENQNNELWQNDKAFLINLINEWCVIYRCYSLYIK